MIVVWLILAAILGDLIRSVVVVRTKYRHFYAGYRKKPQLYHQGKGPDCQVVILGDSTFDGSSLNKLRYGPAEAIVRQLASTRRVTVHMLAVEGAKTGDVVLRQLPQLEDRKSVV